MDDFETCPMPVVSLYGLPFLVLLEKPGLMIVIIHWNFGLVLSHF